ncbi:MAG TPA: pitrilysin family protein [Candidatus Saccharimonadales bacterium]|nr:pitrilysin family protein [Candidatus Saccharimonadales bacterium]
MKHSVTEIKLKNGAKGLFVHIADATVMTFELNFRAGEYLVDPKKWETAHLMEHILLGANELYPKARLFQAEIEKNGAYNNASTGVYDITYEAECADFEWQRVLDLMLVAITKPLFLREEFDAEYGNVHEELRARSNNHFRHLSLAMREKYGFIAKTDQERLKLMKNVKLKDVREHYERTHVTNNLRFVVAGNITPKREQLLQEILEGMSLPKGYSRLALPDERPKQQEKPLYILDNSVKNVYFYVDIFLKRRMSDPETDALSLTNTMLTETLYSKILGTARERGLVYGMSSGWGQSKLNGSWWFGTQVSRKNAPALFDIMLREIENVRGGRLTKAELETAQAYALGRFQRSGQTVGGTAAGYSGRYFFEDIIDDYYQVPKRIKAVTPEAITNIANALLDEKLWGLGVLSNCGEQFTDELAGRLAPLWAKATDK